MAELLASLRASRGDTLALLDSLSEEQLAVRGIHPAWFETSVGGIFRVMAQYEPTMARILWRWGSQWV